MLFIPNKFTETVSFEPQCNSYFHQGKEVRCNYETLKTIKQTHTKTGTKTTAFFFLLLLLLLFCFVVVVVVLLLFLLFLLLQWWTAVQIRSPVRLMPQNQPSGRGLLLSLTARSPDQHPAAMLADVFRHILIRTEGRALGFGQLVRTHTGKCLKCQSSLDGYSDHSAPCAGGR